MSLKSFFNLLFISIIYKDGNRVRVSKLYNRSQNENI